MKDDGFTSIRLSLETYSFLQKIGSKGQTYDQIVRSLVDEHLTRKK